MVKIQPPIVIDFQPGITAKDKDDKSILMIDVRFSAWYNRGVRIL